MEEPVGRAARGRVLNEAFQHARRSPGPALVALLGGAVVGALVAVLAVHVHFGGSGAASSALRPTHALSPPPAQPPPRPTPTTATRTETRTVSTQSPATTSSRGMAAFHGALVEAVEAAKRLHGHVAAAAWVDSWPAPVTAGDAEKSFRLWSMSKPITAIAARETRASLPPAFTTWMTRALVRSENCPQRQMVVALQAAAGSPAAARRYFLRVLEQANASARVDGTAAPPEMSCERYRATIDGTADGDTKRALQLGTAEWTIRDAVSFAHALGARWYDGAGEEVLRVMAEPKERSEEEQPDEFTAQVDWGAGRAFAGWSPAYKAGWGGSRHGNFLAGQYAVVSHGGHTIAAAAVFWPAEQPDVDDPGRTDAPQALETIFGAVRRAAEETYGP